MTQINLSFPQAGGFTLSTVGVQGPSTGGGASSWNDLTDKPTEFPPEDHTHAIADVLLLQGALDAKATAAQGALADTALQPGADIPWTDVSGKPASFPPSAHGHAISDVTGLTAALDGKADDAHTHAIADVTGLLTALDGKQAVLGFTPENAAQKGVAGGYAGLDGTGRVPAGQLPSFVDDVIDVANFAALPVTGESGKIYITVNDNAQFRWSGSAYVQITASPGSTDAVPEGATNLYFTEPRVRGTVLTGYAASGSRTALAAADSILGAFNKIGKWLGDLAAVAFSGSASDLTAGTLPAARFDDTAHGSRAGGALHPAATTSVAGFMSGVDKTKLDGVASDATANAPDATLLNRANHTGTQDAATITGSKTSSFISDFASAVAALITGKANTVHTHTTTDITGFAEAVDDRVAGLLVEGPNVTLTYDDVANTLTIEASGGGGGTPANIGPDYRTKATGTVTLTDTDPEVQHFVGAATGQIVVLPSASSVAEVRRFLVQNDQAPAITVQFGASSVDLNVGQRISIVRGFDTDGTTPKWVSEFIVSEGFYENIAIDRMTVSSTDTSTPPVVITPDDGFTEASFGDGALWATSTGLKTKIGGVVYDLTASGAGGPTGGSAVIDFGPAPGSSVAEVNVIGQGAILAGSRPRAWVQGSTADHNEYEHSRILPGRVGVGVSDIVAGIGFTICAETEMRLTGLVAVKWEWQ